MVKDAKLGYNAQNSYLTEVKVNLNYEMSKPVTFLLVSNI